MNKTEFYTSKLRACGVPEDYDFSLLRYLIDGYLPGHFLTAVISNDLQRAISRADDASLRALKSIVVFLYNYAPSDAWGSQERVDGWLSGKHEIARTGR